MSEKEKTKTGIEEALLEDNSPYSLKSEDMVELFNTENLKVNEPEREITKMLAILERYGFAQGVAAGLNTNLTTGIEASTDDIASRKSRYGTNEIKPRKPTTCCQLLMEPFEDPILKILIAACIVQLAIGIYENGPAGCVDGVSIFIAILIITLVTAGNNYIKEKQFQELQRKQDESTCVVIRNSIQVTISTEELVVGDVVLVTAGNTIPADCLVFESVNISADESALTGEPDELKKFAVTSDNVDSNPVPLVLRSTLCATGSGKAIVCCVGANTMSGRAEQILTMEADQTPLQKKLATIADQIGKLGMAVALMTFVAMVVRTIIKVYVTEPDTEKKGGVIGQSILDALIIAVTVVVVAVPEGLPLAVTISLAFSVSKMYKEQNLVRKLYACETMGGANEICTDKTGTLTQNRMTVKVVYHEGAVKEGDKQDDFMSWGSCNEVSQCVAWNCSAFTERVNDEIKVIGNVTEIGMLNFLMHSGQNIEEMIESKKSRIEMEIPFDSKRKRQTTAVRLQGEEGEGVRLFVKGATEIVMGLCSQCIHEDGEAVELSDEIKDSVLGDDGVLKQFARRSFRCLAVCYRDFTEDEWAAKMEENGNFKNLDEVNFEDLESDLTMSCIFGLMDPLRPGIQQAIAQCHASGINVRMCTGDNIDTACAISLDAGLVTKEELNVPDNEFNPSYVCMTGPNFYETVGGLYKTVDKDGKEKELIKNTNKFEKIASELKVLARSRPEDKYVLVTGLKQLGHVVAVTGDGTNDAPALSKSDIGFAMGIAGSDVAKNASDIILMDDNFCSVITAIKYGRNVFDSVRKFLQFQITVNVVAMFIVFSGSVIFSDPPLNSVQMLWVNLIMDTFAALALATEPPSQSLLDRAPEKRTDKIVNAVMWRNIFGQAIYQIAVLLVLLCCGQKWFKLEYPEGTPLVYSAEYCTNHPEILDCVANGMSEKVVLYTIVFQSFVFMQIFNQVNARKLGDLDYNVFAGFFNNWMFLFIMILTFGVQMLLVQYAGRFATVKPLTWPQQGVCFGIGAFTILWGLIIKAAIPARWFNCLAMNEKEMTEQQAEGRFMSSIKRSHSQVVRQRTGAPPRKSSKAINADADDNFKQE